MRTCLAIALLALAGCAHSRQEEPPATPSAKVEDKTDLIQSRAAAAVQVARTANEKGQPKVVDAELGVAAGYLPRPTSADLEFARQRASKGDQSAYAAAAAQADKHNKELARLRKEASDAVAAAEAKLEAQRLDHEAARQRLLTIALLALGGGGVVAGLAGLWLGFNRANSAASLLVGGAVLAGVRFLDSPWFAVVAVPAIGAFAWEAVSRLRSAR